jgi:hypothetical protein
VTSSSRKNGYTPLLEHDPEKWMPVFRKDHAPAKNQAMIRFNLIGSWSSDPQLPTRVAAPGPT